MRAYESLLDAAQKNCPFAQNWLGVMLSSNDVVSKPFQETYQSKDEAFKWLEMAIEHRPPSPTERLGFFFCQA